MGVKLTGVAAMLATGKIYFFQETEFRIFLSNVQLSMIVDTYSQKNIVISRISQIFIL